MVSGTVDQRLIDYSKLRSALVKLIRQWANLQSAQNRATLSDLDIEAIRESVIKRFDVAMEMTWKLLMKYIADEVGIAEVPNGPKPILRLADQNDLLNGRIDAWLEYVNVRNAGSHDYSAQKADQTLKVIPGFLAEAIALYETMSKKTWEEPP